MLNLKNIPGSGTNFIGGGSCSDQPGKTWAWFLIEWQYE